MKYAEIAAHMFRENNVKVLLLLLTFEARNLAMPRKNLLFRPFRVLGGRDNHYTTETYNHQQM